MLRAAATAPRPAHCSQSIVTTQLIVNIHRRDRRLTIRNRRAERQ
jgi:hypothetical protein